MADGKPLTTTYLLGNSDKDILYHKRRESRNSKVNSSILGKFWTSGLMHVGLMNCSLDLKSTIIRESEEILIVVIVVSKL